MNYTKLNLRWLLILLLSGVCAGGCCQAFPLPGEGKCPTDARRIHLGAGEEAVRRCPCGPDRAFYGHKPTDWRTWPENWRYGHYPCSSHDQASSAAGMQELPITPAANGVQLFNDQNLDAVPPTPVNISDEAAAISTDLPEPSRLPAAQGGPVDGTRDWRSAADVINDSFPAAQPTSNQPPAPSEEWNPPRPAGSTPKQDDPGKGAAARDPLPRRIATTSTVERPLSPLGMPNRARTRDPVENTVTSKPLTTYNRDISPYLSR